MDCEVGGVRRESRGRSGFSGPLKEGRWVIREGPMHAYIPLLWDSTFYSEDCFWSHCIVRRGPVVVRTWSGDGDIAP